MTDRAPTVPPLADRELRLLATFRAVAEAGDLTAAERVLGVERSTISRQVKRLEERLGDTLCQRGPRGFELTAFGRAALDAADDLADALALARDRLAAARGTVTGTLCLGVADNCLDNPAARVVEALERFCRDAPAAEVHLVVDAPSRLRHELLARRLHAVVEGLAPAETRLVAMPLFVERFRLYVGATSGVPAPHVADLDRLGYGAVVRPAEGSPAGRMATRLGLSHRATASGLEAVATLIATGRFAGMLPTHVAEGARGRHRFVEVRGAEAFVFDTSLDLVTERDRPEDAVLSTFRQAALGAHAGGVGEVVLPA